MIYSLLLVSIGIILIMLHNFIKLSSRFLRLIGLLRVIRDSEIEIYYLSLIKKHRKSIEENLACERA